MARAKRSGGYSPSLGFLGPLGAMGMAEPDPVIRNHGKSIARQHMDSPIGRRGATMSSITPGEPMARTMGHYGKKGLPGFGEY